MDAGSILELIDDPVALESLYRESPRRFRQGLDQALERRPEAMVLRVWAARLAAGEGKGVAALRVGLAIAIALGVGLLVRIPALWLGEEWYYPRYAPSLVLLSLAAYFWAGERDRRTLVAGLGLAALAGVYVAFLPGYTDSVIMALLHLPLLWWLFVGRVFSGSAWRETAPRIRFLRYNGELLILGSLVALGGFVFSGLTVALFELARPGIGEWYAENIGVIGAAAIPVAGTYLYDAVFRRQTGIASVLARVFAPLFLIMSGTYLVVAFVGGQNPFVDRDFLITVNGLLIVVLGMTVLSLAERGDDHAVGWVDYITVALLAVTLLIDVVALSAIVFRLASYGFTPNRVVVLGANLVVLGHLAVIARGYLRFVYGGGEVTGVRRAAAGYLPAYAVWAALVVFVLPWVFGFE